ncbi:unnamed protein product [Effrenium voratum]|nr:unnamed protein product [Effrenium voratum]
MCGLKGLGLASKSILPDGSGLRGFHVPRTNSERSGPGRAEEVRDGVIISNVDHLGKTELCEVHRYAIKAAFSVDKTLLDCVWNSKDVEQPYVELDVLPGQHGCLDPARGACMVGAGNFKLRKRCWAFTLCVAAGAHGRVTPEKLSRACGPVVAKLAQRLMVPAEVDAAPPRPMPDAARKEVQDRERSRSRRRERDLIADMEKKLAELRKEAHDLTFSRDLAVCAQQFAEEGKARALEDLGKAKKEVLEAQAEAWRLRKQLEENQAKMEGLETKRQQALSHAESLWLLLGGCKEETMGQVETPEAINL